MSRGWTPTPPKYFSTELLTFTLILNLPMYGLPNYMVIANTYFVPDKYYELIDSVFLSP